MNVRAKPGSFPTSGPKKDRLRIIISPSHIHGSLQKRRLNDRLLFAFNGLGLPRGVRRGNWDLKATRFQDHPTFRLMLAFHEHDYSPEKVLPHYIDYIKQRGQETADTMVRNKAISRVEQYARTYEMISRSMARDGYIPDLSHDDIGLVIGRFGEIIKSSGGNHRLALAMVTGVQHVVASVRFVHRTWYQKHNQGRGRDSFNSIRQGLLQEGFELWNQEP